MKKYIAALLVASMVLMSGVVLADQVGPAVDVGEDTYYVSDTGAIFQETNGFDGLQEEEGDFDGDGDIDPADEVVAP